MQLLASEVSADYSSHPPGIVSLLMLAVTHIQAMTLRIHAQCRFNDHTSRSLDRIMVKATSFVGVTKMGNIVPRGGLEPTSLPFWACVLPLHHVDSLMSPLYPRLPVYAAPYLRGQCNLLQYTL